MTLVFLPRYPEPRKVPTNPRWCPYTKGSPREGQAPWSSNSLESHRPSPRASGAPLSAPLGCSPPSPLSSFLWTTNTNTSKHISPPVALINKHQNIFSQMARGPFSLQIVNPNTQNSSSFSLTHPARAFIKNVRLLLARRNSSCSHPPFVTSPLALPPMCPIPSTIRPRPLAVAVISHDSDAP
jgi:hypothetical protein